MHNQDKTSSLQSAKQLGFPSHAKLSDWDSLDAHSADIDSRQVIRRLISDQREANSSRKSSFRMEKPYVAVAEHSAFKRSRIMDSGYSTNTPSTELGTSDVAKQANKKTASGFATFDLSKKRDLFAAEVKKHFLPQLRVSNRGRSREPSRWKLSVIEQALEQQQALQHSRVVYGEGNRLMQQASRFAPH